MRYYRILIDEKELCSQSLENPTGLQIQFDIKTADEGSTANSQVSVYNPPLWMFGEYNKLYNKKLKLFAGLSETPITQMIGIVPPKQDLITSGYIAGIFPDWNGSNMQMTFILNQSPPYLAATDGRIDLASAPGAYQFNLQKGVSPDKQIRECLDAVAPGVPFVSRVSDFLTPSTCETPIYQVGNLASLLASWGLRLMMGGEGYIMDGRENPSFGQRVQLKKTDFLTQPSALDISTIAITTFLRGDIRMGDLVTMPEKFFVGISQIGDSLQNSTGLEDWLKATGKNVFSMFSGSYLVNKIWHVGDLRNTDVQAWATHMEVVRYSGSGV